MGVLEPEVLAAIRDGDHERARRGGGAAARARRGGAARRPARGDRGARRCARVGLYVPGGRAAYPSTVVMLAVTARTAGVPEIAVCAPPGPRGEAHPGILAACVLCGVDRGLPDGWRAGDRGAGLRHRVRARRGRDRRARERVRAGGQAPALRDRWGWTGSRGRASSWWWPRRRADPEPIALDLLAQAEHGEESPLWWCHPTPLSSTPWASAVERLARERPSCADAELQLVAPTTRAPPCASPTRSRPSTWSSWARRRRPSPTACGAPAASSWAPRAGTAFGDYVAGSNHVLPTGGAARFQSALSPATFRRRMARVSLPGEAAARLAPAGAALARAEGFPVHAESMERRA